MNSTLYHHLQTLISFGSRVIASPGNQAAADYIRDVFTRAGLEVEEQSYACTAWEHEATSLEQGDCKLACTSNAFSLPCEVTAQIVPVGSVAELERVPAAGQVLFLYGDLTRVPLACKSWFLKDERSQHILDLLESLQPAALLSPPTATDYYGQFTEDWELDIPAATVPPAAALHLLQNPEQPVFLEIVCARKPGTARNIVGRRGDLSGGRLVICAHFDTKINTPGATDNGTGAAALLNLAETLPDDLPFGLEFVAFNSEEYLPIGDDEYIRRAGNDFDQVLACINIDGAGAALGSNNITAIACEAGLEDRLRSVLTTFPGVVWTDPWPESNHSTFSFRGIPAIPIGASGVRGLAHSIDDTIEQVSPARLNEVVALVTEVVKIFR
ncbi:MAG: M28 family peptidase [Anaerolineales bacterium]|nr:M28 family peptidase [Anaerolineales bacterium]